MTSIQNGKDLVLGQLKEKALLKQEVANTIASVFEDFKRVLATIKEEYSAEIEKMKPRLRFEYNDNGEFEAELTVAGDILYFTMHSNIFNFDPTHAIYQNDYVKEDESRAYCGMIQIHNFLFDSMKYRRPLDVGYLIGRIFVNKDRHFFVEGKRQLGFLYNDFPNATVNDVYIRAIIESAMIYAIDFDLQVPPYDQVKAVSVQQKLHQQNNQAFATGKRMGFKFAYEQLGIEAKKQ